MKKLYVVSTELEVIVFAESKDEAERVASRLQSYDILQGDLGWAAQEMCWLPADWDLDCNPFGESDSTIGELIEAGAAPAYAAMLKRQTP